MKNILFYTMVCIIFIVVTFFGLGPVILADGAISERIITLIMVLFLYVLLAGIVVYVLKKRKNAK